MRKDITDPGEGERRGEKRRGGRKKRGV